MSYCDCAKLLMSKADGAGCGAGCGAESLVESITKKIEKLSNETINPDDDAFVKYMSIQGFSSVPKEPLHVVPEVKTESVSTEDMKKIEGSEDEGSEEEKENFVLYTAKGKCVSESYFSIKTKNLLQTAIDNDMALVWGSKLKVPDDLWSLLESSMECNKVYDVVFVPKEVSTSLLDGNSSFSRIVEFTLENNEGSKVGEIMVHIDS